MFTPDQYRAKEVEYGELAKTSAGPDERREFQKLKNSVAVLAENEQWLEDNHNKTVHGSEGESGGEHLVAEGENSCCGRGTCPSMPRGSADHAVEYLVDEAAKRAIRQCRIHGRVVEDRGTQRPDRSLSAQAQELARRFIPGPRPRLGGPHQAAITDVDGRCARL